MIFFYIYCTDRLVDDINNKKVLLKNQNISGKNLKITIENDVNYLNSVIEMIHNYGVSSQYDIDDEISEEEIKILENDY